MGHYSGNFGEGNKRNADSEGLSQEATEGKRFYRKMGIDGRAIISY